MSQPLGRVTRDLDGPRGPDVEHEIQVEPSWLGHAVEVTLPRTLRCAHCQGGGCDSCKRSGAVSLREKDAPATVVKVSLPADASGDLRLRIPEQGGTSDDPDEGRGHLLLLVRVSDTSTPEVSLMVAQPTAIELERQMLMKRSLLVAGGLIALFLGLLKLSGWL